MLARCSIVAVSRSVEQIGGYAATWTTRGRFGTTICRPYILSLLSRSVTLSLPHHVSVIVICIEKQAQWYSCILRVAINTKIPQELVNGMRAIAKVIQMAVSQSKQ